MSKPRVRFRRTHAVVSALGYHGWYECSHGGWVGRGTTIAEAYHAWKAKYPNPFDLNGNPIAW